ncbi:hypothetical protein SUGI_0732860 [Cryptomeria japonica]|nr:hypothetical protein SUGI_0732860 [Cryptomeria japonica]
MGTGLELCGDGEDWRSDKIAPFRRWVSRLQLCGNDREDWSSDDDGENIPTLQLRRWWKRSQLFCVGGWKLWGPLLQGAFFV